MAQETSVPSKFNRYCRPSEVPSGFTIVLSSLKMNIMIPTVHVPSLLAVLDRHPNYFSACAWARERPLPRWSQEHIFMAATPYLTLSPAELRAILADIGVDCVSVLHLMTKRAVTPGAAAPMLGAAGAGRAGTTSGAVTEARAYCDLLTEHLLPDGYMAIQVGCRMQPSCDGETLDAVIGATCTENDLLVLNPGGPSSRVADVELYPMFVQAQQGGLCTPRDTADDDEARHKLKAHAGAARQLPVGGGLNIIWNAPADDDDDSGAYVAVFKCYPEIRRDVLASHAECGIRTNVNPFSRWGTGDPNQLPVSVRACDRQFDACLEAGNSLLDCLEQRTPSSSRLRVELECRRVRSLTEAIDLAVAILTPCPSEEQLDLGICINTDDDGQSAAVGHRVRSWAGPPGAGRFSPCMPVCTLVAIPFDSVKDALLKVLPRASSVQRRVSTEVCGEIGRNHFRGSAVRKLELVVLMHSVFFALQDCLGMCSRKPLARRRRPWGRQGPRGAEHYHAYQPRSDWYPCVHPEPSGRRGHYAPAEWPYGEQLQEFTPFRFDRRFHPTRPDYEFGFDHYASLRWRANAEDDQYLGNGAVQALSRAEARVRYAHQNLNVASNPDGMLPHWGQCGTWGGAYTYYSTPARPRGFAWQAGRANVIAFAVALGHAAYLGLGQDCHRHIRTIRQKSVEELVQADRDVAIRCQAAVRAAMHGPLRGMGPMALLGWRAVQEAAVAAGLRPAGQIPPGGYAPPVLVGAAPLRPPRSQGRPAPQFVPAAMAAVPDATCTSRGLVDCRRRFSVWVKGASPFDRPGTWGSDPERNPGYPPDRDATFGPRGGDDRRGGDDSDNDSDDDGGEEPLDGARMCHEHPACCIAASPPCRIGTSLHPTHRRTVACRTIAPPLRCCCIGVPLQAQWFTLYLAQFAGDGVAPFSFMNTITPLRRARSGRPAHAAAGVRRDNSDDVRASIGVVARWLREAHNGNERPHWIYGLRLYIRRIIRRRPELRGGLLEHIALGELPVAITGHEGTDQVLSGQVVSPVPLSAVALEAVLVMMHVDFKVSSPAFRLSPFRDCGDEDVIWQPARQGRGLGLVWDSVSATQTAELWALRIVLADHAVMGAPVPEHRRLWWEYCRVSEPNAVGGEGRSTLEYLLQRQNGDPDTDSDREDDSPDSDPEAG